MTQAFDLDNFIDDGQGNFLEPDDFRARVSSMNDEDIRALLLAIDENREELCRRRAVSQVDPVKMQLPKSAPLPFRLADVLLSSWVGCQIALAGLREADESVFENGRDAFVSTRLEEIYAELDKIVSKLDFGEPQTSVCLPAEEIWEATRRCLGGGAWVRPPDLCICMKVQDSKIYCITAGGETVIKDKSNFPPNEKVTPDFNRIGITDGGQTLVFGEYEAEFVI